MPDTAENLVVKFYTAIGLSFAGRGIEIQPVSRSDVHKLQRVSDGQIYYGVDFERFVHNYWRQFFSTSACSEMNFDMVCNVFSISFFIM